MLEPKQSKRAQNVKYLLIGLLAITFSLPGFAKDSEADKRESVKELMTLMDVDSMLETMYAQMGQMSAGMAQQMGITASEQGIFDNYMKGVITSMRETVSWERMEAPMTDIYLKTYTEEEIEDLLSFYRSSTGRSLIKKMPEVMGESMKLSQSMMAEFMPKMKELAAEFAEELGDHRESH